MMRGDTAARTAHCKDMFLIGAYSDNDVREYMGKNPIENGDRYYIPLNMVPTDQVGIEANSSDLDEDAESSVPSVDARAKALRRAKNVNLRFFRDAIGRVLHRNPSERAKYAATAFLQPVLNVIQCVLGDISPEMEAFAALYAAEIGESSAGWKEESAEIRSSNELDLCIDAVLKRSAI